MGKPFFSVIVTEHNSAAFMRKGLDSIRAQTFQDYELIIVCDNCTDNTVEIAKEYMRPDRNDCVLEVHNGKAGLSRNDGLDAAEGEWILWMDDDDWYLHECAFNMIHEALVDMGDKIDILAYSFIWKDANGPGGTAYARNLPTRIWPAIWNKAWRRSFIGDERFPDWDHSDDLGFALQTHPKALKEDRMFFWDMPFYYYNFMRPGSISDRIEKGEYDHNALPECYQKDAEDYEKVLRNRKLKL